MPGADYQILCNPY